MSLRKFPWSGGGIGLRSVSAVREGQLHRGGELGKEGFLFCLLAADWFDRVTAQCAKFKDLSAPAFQPGDAIIAQHGVAECAAVGDTSLRMSGAEQAAI